MNEQNNNGNLNNNQGMNSAMNFGVPNSPNNVNQGMQPVNNNQVMGVNPEPQPVMPSALNFNTPTDNGANQGLDTGVNNQVSNETPLPNMNFSIPNADNNGAVENTPVSENTQVISAIPNASMPVQNDMMGTVNNLNNTINPQPVGSINQPNDTASIPNNPQVMPTNTLDNSSVSNDSVLSEEEKPKKKISPVVVIAAILVIVVGLAAGYYFLLETPKKVFGVAYDKLMSSIKSNQNGINGYVNYNLSLNVNSDNQMYKPYLDIINNISLNGTSGLDKDGKSIVANGMLTYKNNQLVNLSMFVDGNTNTGYVKLNGLFDKVLMIKEDASSSDVASSIDTNPGDYVELENSILSALEKTLDGANYKKELVALNGSRVTKSTLFIDKQFLQGFYDNLINDAKFLSNYAKITGNTTDEVKKELDKSINELEANNELLVIYTSLIKNEFLKLEFISDTDKLTVNKNGDNYNYEITEDNNTVLNGSINISKVADETNLVFNANIIDEAINFTMNCTYSIVNDIDKLDTTGAVDVNTLSEEDTNQLMSNFMSNQAFMELLSDLGLGDDDMLALDSMI